MIFLTIFIYFFHMYMVSLQNIRTLSEEKTKKIKAPNNRKSSVLKEKKHTSKVE